MRFKSIMNRPKVCFYTLGCKLNFSETSTIARSFSEKGYRRVEFDDSPDVYVINTCSVTENADKKCRSLVNRALRVSPQSFIAIIGCYAQLKPEEIAQIPGVDLVLGASEKFNLPHYILNHQKRTETAIHACSINEVNEFIPSFSKDDRTRTFFKVQDGCDYSCAFCTIPLARGGSRSATVAETVEQARKLIQLNKPSEIVLTGVNTGDFGRKHGESFYELVCKLDQLEGVQRFRISSIEPNLLSDEIISFCASSDKFVPHFHIPLQSGSDRILRLMRRRYQRELYTRRVEAICAAMPDASIGVDVIVGFPGETETDFRETFDYLVDLPISYLHVFTYSERDNTIAATMRNVVDGKVRSQRSEMLRILSEKKKQAFYRTQLGTKRKVLWEAEQNGNSMFGFTDNYVKVRTSWNKKRINTISEVKLLEVDAEGIVQCADLLQTA